MILALKVFVLLMFVMEYLYIVMSERCPVSMCFLSGMCQDYSSILLLLSFQVFLCMWLVYSVILPIRFPRTCTVVLRCRCRFLLLSEGHNGILLLLPYLTLFVFLLHLYITILWFSADCWLSELPLYYSSLVFPLPGLLLTAFHSMELFL